MIKAVLFDLDGVIIKDPIFSTVYAAEFGITPEDMFPFFTGPFKKCLVGQADTKEVIKPYLKEWKWSGTVDELMTYWFTHHQDVDQGVVDIIKRLQIEGAACYLATNQAPYRTAYIWNELGMKNIFKGKFISCELGVRKPQRAFFTKILEKLNIAHPEEIVLIEDTASVLKDAQNCGLKTIAYTNPTDLQIKLSKLITV